MTLAEAMYNAYNAGGSDPAFVNKNFRGDPCPAWDALPENVREKWQAAAAGAVAFCALPGSDFGWALNQLRQGRRVRRSGWNGKGMWLALTEGSEITPAHGTPTRGAAALLAEHEQPESIRIGAHIDMRAADGSLVIGWLASQTDMLATDWEIAE